MKNPVLLADLAATERLAQSLAPHLQTGDMLTLRGDLGAGKTTFARALLRTLGVGGEVPSPTFTLVQQYDLPDFTLHHFDLYRLKSAAELDELGWDDACHDGLTIVEWPERAANRLKRDHLELHFMLDSNGSRHCEITPHGVWIERMK